MIDIGNREVSLLRPFSKEITISSPYGEREINGKKEFHYGYDFKTPIATTGRACADGSVFRAGWQNDDNHADGFGFRLWQEVEIEGHRLYIYYAHLLKILVKESDRIKRGQEIILTGNSGRSTGPHCHIECRIKDTKDRMKINWEEI